MACLNERNKQPIYNGNVGKEKSATRKIKVQKSGKEKAKRDSE